MHIGETRAPWAIGVILGLAATAAAAQVELVHDRFYVLPDEVPFEIPVDELQGQSGNGASRIVYTQPVHGRLRPGGQPRTLLYTPRETFWILGMDSFTYTRLDPAGESAIVLLVAELHGRQTTVAGFEGGDLGGLATVGDSIEVVAGAALDGAYGMRVEGFGTPSFVVIDDENGGGDTGSSSGGCEADLLAPPEGREALLPGDTVEVLSVGPADGGDPGIRVLMKQEGDELFIGAELPYDDSDVSWIGVDDEAHEIVLDWWKPDEDGGGSDDDGMLLVIDDAVSQHFEHVGLDQVAMEEYRFGLITVPSFSGLVVDFDNIVVRTGDATSSVASALLVDDFEDGVSPGWEGEFAPNMTTDTAAAQTGSGGLAIPLGRNETLMLMADTPGETEQYNVRFRLDPNSLKASQPLTLVELFGGAGAKPPLLAYLRLRLRNGSYQLDAVVPTRGSTGWVPIADASTVVELQWRAAASNAMRDGGVALWVGGAYAGEVARLANPDGTVRSVRFGVAGARTAEGTLYLDDFESWSTAPDHMDTRP